MNDHLEDTLRRELREVADRLPVPPQPALPQPPVRTGRHWRPLLVAAVVTLIVGAVAAMAVYGGGRSLQPAGPPSPTPTSAPTGGSAARPLTALAPTVPYRFDVRLYVDGNQVPGSWVWMDQTRGVWVAHRSDDTFWWGTGAEPRAIEGNVTMLPAISPDGSRLLVTRVDPAGEERLTLIDTRSGETINELPLEEKGLLPTAVTDAGQVFFGKGHRQLMWLADDGRRVVDLKSVAPDPTVRASTTAGLIMLDGETVYLGRVSAAGVMTREETLPSEDVVFNPSGTWVAEGGTRNGIADTFPYITTHALDRSREVRLQPPDGQKMRALTWEDDDLLLVTLYNEWGPTGLARCSIREERCLAL